MNYVNCELCPRKCGVNRALGQTGFCGCPGTALVAKAMLHKWEEPALAGSGGSGAVFFGGCTLRCRYCQNAAISGGAVGKAMDSTQLRALFEELIAQGAENIDLVTPTHFLPDLLPALSPKLPVPVVYNCGGYESVNSLKLLENKVQIYLPDLKYADDELAIKYSDAPDYFEIATNAIKEMYRQVGNCEFDEDGIMTKGVIIRHLILPNNLDNTKRVIDWVKENFNDGEVLFSLMSQFTPNKTCKIPELSRRLTQEEYDEIEDYLFNSGIEDGFMQELSSAKEEYIPPFNLEGV